MNEGKALRFLQLVVIFFLVAGCTNTVTVKGNFPTPLVQQLPLNVGVVYDSSFKLYEYKEQSEDRDDWRINIGPAQHQLFSTVLPAMFRQVTEFNGLGASPEGSSVDLIIQPLLSEFQYNVPNETKVQMFEVWMKYNVKVFESDGELIADWIMTAYGKTPSELIKSKETALNEAMNVALRDAGANLSLTFARVPEIRAWMHKHQTSKL